MYPDPNGTLVGNPNKKALFHRLPQGRSCYTPSNKPWPLKMDSWKTSCLLSWPIFTGYVSFRDPVAFRELYTQGISVVKLGLVCLFGLFRMISLPKIISPKGSGHKEWIYLCLYIYIYIYMNIYIYIYTYLEPK